jgi:L-asparaginase II
VASPHAALVEVTRGSHVEARHWGSFVLLAADGRVEVAAGAVDTPVLARSSLKPLQAVALLEAGFAGPPDWIALACASHAGEPAHVAGVRAMLSATGLREDDLQCPPSLPLAEPALIAWVTGGGHPARVCHNCSGKHAAMLTATRVSGWPLPSYRDPAHPLQQAIRRRLSELCGEPAGAPEVDGCGAPAFAVSMVGLARAVAAIGTGSGGALVTVADAMRARPELVSESTGPHVELSRAVPGLVAKDGAEGMLAAALPDGRAFTAKFADGTDRGRPPLLAAVLRRWGFDGPVISRWASVPTLGAGRPVGAVRPTAELLALLDLA